MAFEPNKEKINIEEKVVVKEMVAKENIAPFRNITPAQWQISPAEKDGYITASNNISGETFEGSIADFNKALRA